MTAQSPHPPVAVDAAIAALQARVGERVRAARKARAMSRRVLSEVSGVSPRYLAQIEGGEGNISIALLLRVADALGTSMEALVTRADLSPQAVQMAEAYGHASADVRAQIDALLSTAPAKAGRICLIGLRGAGKSTLGLGAAKALDLPFVELNRAIEATGGMPIAEIMALYGADGYRQLEADALAEIVATRTRAVVAVAGGIVDQPQTFDHLLQRFHTVWIKAAPEDHMARVRAQGDTRPMAGEPRAMEQLRGILSAREAAYGRADATLDTHGETVDASLLRLLALIHARNFIQKDTP